MAAFKTSRSASSGSIGGKIGVTFFGLVFLLMGLAFTGLLASEIRENFYVRSWEKTPCVILESRVETVADGYMVFVRYRYEKNGRRYDSGQIRMGESGFTEKSVDKADALAETYDEGNTSDCYVNPENPSQAVLEHNSLFILFFIPIPLLFACIGGAIIYGVWIYKKKAPKTYSLSAKASRKRAGRWAAAAVFLAFFIAGAASGYFLFFPPIYKSFTSGNWIETDCAVQSSRVQSHDSDDGTTYSVDIVYAYSFQGKSFRSNQYKFLGGSSSGYYGKAEVVKRYPEGKHALCYVNPDHPSEAVLKREMGAEILFGLIPIAFMAAGLYGVFYFVRGKPDATNVHPLYRKTLSVDAAGRIPQPAGHQILKPRQSYSGKIMGIVLVSIFWNGVVSVFVFQAIRSFRAGHPEYFLSIFMIPFVGVGILLIGGIFYFILAAFNPRPCITLLKDRVRLGERVGVTWTCSGNVYKIENFKLTLIGEETATYRNGEDTCTDKQVFYRRELVNSHQPETLRAGEAEFTIPAESMHSFKSDHNAVLWKIQMRCDVPKWPDSVEDFEIRVYPLTLKDV